MRAALLSFLAGVCVGSTCYLLTIPAWLCPIIGYGVGVGLTRVHPWFQWDEGKIEEVGK